MSQYNTNSTVPALGAGLPAGRVVRINGGALVAAANASSPVVGVTFQSGTTGEYVAVVAQGSGITMDASGSISAGNAVHASADGDGKVMAGTAALASGSAAYFVGTAEDDAAGGKVRVTVSPYYVPVRS